MGGGASWDRRTNVWLLAQSGHADRLDDQSRTWDRVWDIVGPFVIAVVGIYYVYQLMKRLDKAEGEVRWLSYMLKQVKDNGQVDYAELERRLERLESAKLTDEGT